MEPVDEPPLYGWGPVAEGRPQKYRGSEKGWPMREEPISFAPAVMTEPDACRGKMAFAMPVTASG